MWSQDICGTIVYSFQHSVQPVVQDSGEVEIIFSISPIADAIQKKKES
jgi:hypothetical protein